MGDESLDSFGKNEIGDKIDHVLPENTRIFKSPDGDFTVRIASAKHTWETELPLDEGGMIQIKNGEFKEFLGDVVEFLG